MHKVITCPPLDHVSFTHTATDGTQRAWDVTEALRIVADGRSPMLFNLPDHSVTVETILRFYPDLDESYAISADLARPLLFIPFFGENLLIDGWHRLYKAANLEVPDVLIYLLSQEEADRIKWLEIPPMDRSQPEPFAGQPADLLLFASIEETTRR